jgi:hypothetical protein
MEQGSIGINKYHDRKEKQANNLNSKPITNNRVGHKTHDNNMYVIYGDNLYCIVLRSVEIK